MKNLAFIWLSLFIFRPGLFSQSLCNTCPCLLEQGDLKAAQGKNPDAISLYQAYIVCDPTKVAEVTQKINKIQRKIESEKIRAQQAEKRAEISAADAKNQKKRADEEAKKSRAQSRSNHNLAVTLRTLQQDPTMAIRMAEYTLNGESDDAGIQQVYADIISNGENYFYRRQSFTGHSGKITEMALSPGGQRILTTSNDKTARIWDNNGRQIRIIEALPGAPTFAQFSPDGGKIMAGDSSWYVIADTNGRKLATVIYPKDNPVSEIAFSKDGSYWVQGDKKGCIRRWDSNGIKDSFLTNAGRISRVYFSAGDDYVLACNRDSVAILWNINDAAKSVFLRGHTGGVKNGAFSPTGDSVLTVGNMDNTARLWNIKGDSLGIFSEKSSVLTRAAFLRNDSIFMEFRDKPPVLKDLKKQDFRRFQEVKNNSYDAKLRGNYLLVLLKPKSGDKQSNSSLAVRIFSREGGYKGRFFMPAKDDWPDLTNVAANQDIILYFKNGNTFESYRFSKQQPTIFSPPGPAKKTKNESLGELTGATPYASFSSDSRIFVYHLPDDVAATVQKVADIPPPKGRSLLRPQKKNSAVVSFIVNPKPNTSGRYFFLMLNADSTVSLLDTTARERWTTANISGPIVQAQFASDGNQVFTLHADSTFWLWNPETNQRRRIGKYPGALFSASLSPDGAKVAASGSDRRIHIWSVSEQREKIAFPEFDKPVEEVTFLPDSKKFLVRTSKGEVSLWDETQPEKPLKIWRGYWSESNEYGKSTARGWDKAILSPSGNRILLIGEENAPTLSDLEGDHIIELYGHTAPIETASFSADGRYVLTASQDSTARLWNLHGKTISVFVGEHQNGIRAVAISPDGRKALTVDGAGTAHLWKTPAEWLNRGVEQFTPNDLAINDLLPDPDQIDSITHAKALEQAASNFLKQQDTITAHKLYDYLLKKFPEQGDDVWYNWYMTGSRQKSDLDTLMEWARPLYPVAENFKKDKLYREAKVLYEHLIDKEERTGLLWDYIEVCNKGGLAINKKLFLKEPDAGKLAYYAQYFQSKSDVKTARNLFWKSLQLQTNAQSLIGLMEIHNPEDRQPVREKIAGLTETDDLLDIANYLWEKKRDLGAAELYQKVMKTAELAEAGIGLYEISQIKPDIGFGATQMAQSNSREVLRSYADYFGGKGDVPLKLKMLGRIVDIGKADSHDYFERYLLLQTQGSDIFGELLELQSPPVLKGLVRNFAFQGGAEPLLIALNYYEKATLLGERLIELENTPANREELSQHCNSLGWYNILAGNYGEAENSIRRGIKYYRDNLMLYTNLPHTLLFQGKFEEAHKVYMDNQAKEYQPERNRPYIRDVYLADFTGFKKDFKENPNTKFTQKMMDDIQVIENQLKAKQGKKVK